MATSSFFNRFGIEGKEHWREHLPKLYARLEAAGTLEHALLLAQAATMREMSALEARGLTPDESWEMTREKYLILREEPGAKSKPPSNPIYEALMDGEGALSRFLNHEDE